MPETPRAEVRSTHDVYRIGADFSWHETPCFCPANRTHSVADTRPVVVRPDRNENQP